MIRKSDKAMCLSQKTDIDYINAISGRNSMLSYVDFSSSNVVIGSDKLIEIENGVYDIIKSQLVSHSKYVFIENVFSHIYKDKYDEEYNAPKSITVDNSERKSEEVFEYSKMNIMNTLASAKLDSNTDHFIDVLRNTHFEEGMDNVITGYFEQMKQENHLALKNWFNKTFISYWNDDEICTKMLMLLCDYSYEEFEPHAQTIALASKDHPSKKVASAAMNLFGHWANKESLGFLVAMKEPQEHWLKIKRDTLINDIRSHLCI